MAKQETYRTFAKLCLINYCAVTIIIVLQLGYALASESESNEEALQNVTSVDSMTDATSENPVAEPLVRFRRQPPRTIVKHIIRPKRYKMKRVKRPKIKYSFAEPPTTYYSRKPIMIKKPTFDSSILEDFSHMNVESADFDLPPSSYEAQSMDLDLYRPYEPSIEAASYKEVHKPSVYTYAEPEISYTEVTKSPSYTYSVPEISFKETSKPSAVTTYTYAAERSRKPHTKYGLPTDFVYSTGYDKPSSEHKYKFEAPASKPAYTDIEKPYFNTHVKNEYFYNKPAKEVSHIPATTYGVPDVHITATGSSDYNKYSLVEQQPTYTNYAPAKTDTYHFAEPPPQPHPQPEPSVEITYSPSYEINIPSSHENSYAKENYHKTQQHHPPPQQFAPNAYEERNYPEEAPSQQQQQQHPGEHYQPTNVYEDPPEQDNFDDDAVPHQEVSGTHQPSSYHPAPPRHQPIEEFPPSQNLPINANHKHPPYDYPKSSYEVPIYDPIPFDSSNHQQREIYPPQTYDQLPTRQQQPSPNNNHQPPEQNPPPKVEANDHDVHATDTAGQTNGPRRPQSPINHLGRTRKRKRNKGSASTTSTTKHILDVPELEEAFEKENRNKYLNTQEPDAHASQRFENVKDHNIINNNYSKGPWNPMKIRTSPIMLLTTNATSTTPTRHTLNTKHKRYHYKQQRTTPTSTTTSSSSTSSAAAAAVAAITPSASTAATTSATKVEIISIERSKSKSFYDGVFSTPKIYNANFNRNRFRLENTSMFSAPQMHDKSTGDNQFSKRTTKNAFDTTVFKSPITDRDVYRNLPKNHKFI